MTTVTDSDIKEIKEALAALAKQMAENDKNVSNKFIEISGKIDTTNAKIDGLDKRLSILEAIYQRFFNVMLGFLGTSLAAIVFKFIWDNFKFVV